MSDMPASFREKPGEPPEGQVRAREGEAHAAESTGPDARSVEPRDGSRTPPRGGDRTEASPPWKYQPLGTRMAEGAPFRLVGATRRGAGCPFTWRARLWNLASPAGAVLVSIFGALIFVSTWLSWVAGTTGWTLMLRSYGTTTNFLFSVARGLFLFSGFWSMTLGALVAAGGFMLLAGRDSRRFTIIFGALGALIAGVNVMMIYLHSYGFGSPGIGMWLFAACSLAVIPASAAVVPGSYHRCEREPETW